ncbi:glucodextranase DOMON-like domain-containing protein [Corallococcus soli]|uniref:glucodextranase DOMON-like domain-containing protein n=1 Tax=Corallococcus soli TaxID=2710757 RepID=UPI00186BBAF7|nr:glucodextranase DOMON-like domain-containing protein [Corallococcus soli]
MIINPRIAFLTLAASLVASPALADKVSFKDPTGDDKGPGKYTYPTDPVYKAGSFDLTGVTVDKGGNKTDITIQLKASVENPWKMTDGFSVQEVFLFIDTDHKTGSGFTDSPPGLNVAFAPADAWEKVVVISPQGSSRVRAEANNKAGAMKSAVVVPTKVRASGNKITATVMNADLADSDPSTWGFQVVMQSNEGFPAGNDLLTRRVNEYEGQHRFGGGTDFDCDPHVIDTLAGEGKGDASEAKAQYEMLAYECGPDGSSTKKATLKMVSGPKRPAASGGAAAAAPAAPAPAAPVPAPTPTPAAPAGTTVAPAPAPTTATPTK